MKFGAIADYFSTQDANLVLATVKVGKDETPVDITANMVVEAMNHEVGLLTKKHSDSGKLTKLQEANLKLTEQLYNGMEMNRAYSVSEIIKTVPGMGDFTPSKVRPLLTPLMDAGKVVREEVKGRPLFTKVQ
jgi:hypothetical protein